MLGLQNVRTSVPSTNFLQGSTLPHAQQLRPPLPAAPLPAPSTVQVYVCAGIVYAVVQANRAVNRVLQAHRDVNDCSDRQTRGCVFLAR